MRSADIESPREKGACNGSSAADLGGTFMARHHAQVHPAGTQEGRDVSEAHGGAAGRGLHMPTVVPNLPVVPIAPKMEVENFWASA